MTARRPRAPRPAAPVDPLAAAARELGLLKLASSGLGPADLDRLRWRTLTPAQTQALHPSFAPVCSLQITYWDPADPGRPLAAHPAWPPFYRLRYLRPGGDARGDLRYTNEPATGVVAYFPPTVDWPAVMADPDQTLLVTEGELKAAKACLEGCPCVGLGGVWNFKSSALGTTFLRELEGFAWARRRVYVVYDSDVVAKAGVQDALNALAGELAARGALPFLVLVPEGDGGRKQGLDDWCVANPGASLRELCARHQPLTQVRKLFELNERLIYITGRSIVVDRRSGDKSSVAQFKEVYQNVDYAELTVTDGGAVSLRKAPVAAGWLKWPLRSQARSMTYRPGAPSLIEPGDPVRSAYNLWPGWGCQPAEGDAGPFLDLVAHLFRGADPADLAWFLRWCAYPLQYPGTKMFTSCLLHGIRHGTGKSLVGYTLARIYGANFTEIDQIALHSGFNTWAEAKQLVMGDDVTGSNKREDNDRLKKLITQRELRVNTKFMPEYVVPDVVNYYFTSNHPDAFFLEDDDRRSFVHEVLSGPLDEAFYMEYGLWLDTGGPSALFHHLLHLDLGDFNPSAAARRTLAKEQMTADARSDLSTWVRRLRAEPDDVLRVGGAPVPGALFTSAELLALYDPSGSGRVTANGLSRELRRAGVPRANRGLPLRGPGGTDRYYVLRDADRWAGATSSELAAQLALQAGRKR